MFALDISFHLICMLHMKIFILFSGHVGIDAQNRVSPPWAVVTLFATQCRAVK